jgi:HEAT repeat protein
MVKKHFGKMSASKRRTRIGELRKELEVLKKTKKLRSTRRKHLVKNSPEVKSLLSSLPDDIQPIAKNIFSTKPMERKRAILALSQRDVKKASPLIALLLKDPIGHIRGSAILCLTRFKYTQAIPEIKRIALEKDSVASRTAIEALEKLSSNGNGKP